jgi:micrococcal nuclease
MIVLFFACLLLLLMPAAGLAQTYEARVLSILDGDTIEVRIGDQVERVRYIGVNTPEIHHPRKGKEPYGEEAKQGNRRLVDISLQ